MAFISVSENESTHPIKVMFVPPRALPEQNLPYSALLAYNSALEKTDKGAVSTVSEQVPCNRASKVVGDSDIRLEVLSKSKNSELTEEDISHKYYLLARNAARSGNGGALKNSKMIKDASSDFIEAKNMESVIFHNRTTQICSHSTPYRRAQLEAVRKNKR